MVLSSESRIRRLEILFSISCLAHNSGYSVELVALL